MPKQRYYVPSELKHTFWIAYCNAVSEGKILGLTEKWEEEMPVFQDTDLKYPIDMGKNRKYTAQHVISLVRIYQEVFREILEDLTDQQLVCCVLEKKAPYVDKGFVKEGFHLHFPYIVLPINVQQMTVRERVLEKVIREKLFSDLKTYNSIESIIDGNIPRVTWMMYGSRKDVRGEPYLLTKIYDHKLSETSISDALMDLVNMLRVEAEKPRIDQTVFKRVSGNESGSDMDDDDLADMCDILDESKNVEDKEIIRDFWLADKEFEYYLPVLLSIKGREITNTLKANVVTRSLRRNDKATSGHNKVTSGPRYDQARTIPTENIHRSLDEVQELMIYMDDSRYTEYRPWMEMGWFLHSIGNGTDRAKNMWKDFSRRWEHYREGECDDLWNEMYYGNHNLYTMRTWARHDSPDEFRNWRRGKIEPYVSRAVKSKSNYDVAYVLFKLYEGQYVCSSAKKNKWYEFRNHRWVFLDDGMSLKQKISNELCDEFALYNSSQSIRRTSSNDEIVQDECDRNSRDATNIIYKLKITSFKSAVMTECKELFYREKFDSKLDTNPNLIGFDNGVYDLQVGVFREGRPEDNITLSTGYNYVEYHVDDEDIIEVVTFLRKVFVNVKLRKYFMRYMSSCLMGGNINKHFMIFTGRKGNNAKSVTVKLIEKSFGNYSCKAPTSLITGQRPKSNEANPEMEMARGKKVLIAQEPGEGERINIGVIKELTGFDSIYVRGLFEDGSSMIPLFKLILQCNKIPRIPAHDKAGMNRTKVLEFQSVFDENAPLQEKKQRENKHFSADPNFDRKLDDMAPAFMWLLLQEYSQYVKFGIKEPDEVKQAIQEYKQDNDLYHMFIEECITEDPNSSLSLTDVWSEFVPWYKDAYQGQKLPLRGDLHDELKIRWGTKQVRKKWIGYALNYESDHDGESGRRRLTVPNMNISRSASR
jgi:P4 family phage/plasmid primase-like protien